MSTTQEEARRRSHSSTARHGRGAGSLDREDEIQNARVTHSNVQRKTIDLLKEKLYYNIIPCIFQDNEYNFLFCLQVWMTAEQVLDRSTSFSGGNRRKP